MKTTLSPIERRTLSAKAHALDPVVMIGGKGLTPAVMTEIDRALTAHELIKVRAVSDEREQREQWLTEICDQLNAAPVKHLGKLFIIWREKKEALAEPVRRPARKPASSLTRRKPPLDRNKSLAPKTPLRRRVIQKGRKASH